MSASLSIMLVTRGEFDVQQALLECVYDAFADQGGDDPDATAAEAMIEVIWSRTLKINDGRKLHRAAFTPAIGEEQDEATSFALMRNFAARVRKLVGNADPGITHAVHFANAAQRHDHESLYREIYEIEMRLREVLTFIFLDEFPDQPYEFLDRSTVKLEGDIAQHSAEYLAAHTENQLFQILFKSYLALNNPPGATVINIVAAAKDQATYEGFRDAISDVPIKKQSHLDFLAFLKSVVPDIEAVRNAVAHNRDLPNSAKQKYDEARKKLDTALEEFWTAEVDDRTPPPEVVETAVPPPESEEAADAPPP